MPRKGQAGAKRGPNGGKLDEREIEFLANYYGEDSPTKGKRADSAKLCGYTDGRADHRGRAILIKYGDCSFRESAKAVGITKPYLAFRLKQILEKGSDKEILAGIRLTLANFGESTDQSGGGGTFNINAPTMVIVGASAERMKALREASAQPTREQLEEQRAARAAERLEALKRGDVPEHEKHKSGYIYRKPRKVIDVQAKISNLDIDDDRHDSETQP